jgi:hypothetical protein
MTWLHAAKARFSLLPRRAAESRIDDEIRFHIEMETERLVREKGLTPDEARRRALVTFGGVQQHRETLREGRGTAWLNGMSLDLKLGSRMLVKYPGLTVVGGLAMAFGIWFGAVTFEMLGIVTTTKLPLPDADRIVQIEIWDVKANNAEEKALHDFQLWRSSVRSVTDFGAPTSSEPTAPRIRRQPRRSARRHSASRPNAPSTDASSPRRTSGPARHLSPSSATSSGATAWAPTRTSSAGACGSAAGMRP